MSTGKARRIHSAIFFDTKEGNSRIPSKWKRDELTPITIVQQIFASTPSQRNR